jgi:hypothetical protein
MAVDWNDTETWGTHVHYSEWGSWLPEKTRSNDR